MSNTITGSVGRWDKGAANANTDVRTVQRLLEQAATRLGDAEIDPKGVDGKISKPPRDSSTVGAIEAFQTRFTSHVDGLIEPGSQTWQSLQEAAGADDVASTTSGSFFFPFAELPDADWIKSPRKFAANRASGARAHAGCDLYFPKGTPIHAVADGRVVRGPYPFYMQTYALEVDHGDFVARYGEIQSATTVSEGDRVTAGQRIAKVGHLVGITVPSDMLHFELYDKTRTGSLTVTDSSASAKRSDGVPFMRRRDLMDPTPLLNQWKEDLPPAPKGGTKTGPKTRKLSRR